VETKSGVPRRVLLRDLAIFQVKLILDGVKDIVLVQLSLIAAVVDVIFGGSRRGKLFYAVLRFSERFDLWLNLNRAAQGAEQNRDGLVGATPRGADGLITRIESLLRLLASFARRKWVLRRSAAENAGAAEVRPGA
jgi:hypothetical protein